jgi:hypothetical protein
VVCSAATAMDAGLNRRKKSWVLADTIWISAIIGMRRFISYVITKDHVWAYKLPLQPAVWAAFFAHVKTQLGIFAVLMGAGAELDRD